MRRSIASCAAVAFLAAACVGGTAPNPSGGAATSAGTTGGSAQGSAGSPGADASGKVVLLEGIGEDPSVSEPYAESVVKAFRDKYPNIDLQREAVENDQLRTIIQTRLSSNDPPDLFGYDTGPGFGGVLASAGLVKDLGPYYEQFGWPHFDWAKTRCTYGGKVSCLPDQVEELIYYYNKEWFDSKGLSEPQTLEDLDAIAEAAKADGKIPLAYGNGGDDSWTSGHQFSMTASNILGREGLDARIYGEQDWNTPEVVKAIDVFFKGFVDKGYFPPQPTALGYDDANDLFYSGQAVMLPSGTWLSADMNQKAEFEVGIFPFPSIDGSSISPPSGVGGGMFMANNSDNPDAAAVVMDYYHSPETMRTRMEEQFVIPAYAIDSSGLDLPPLFQEVLSDLAESSGTSGTFGYNIDVLTPAGFNTVMAEGFQQVMNGDRTPQEQADALEEAFQKAFDAGETPKRP
jgi:raffinose/stachyose/melibiose transport system substrate-binding protein